MSQRIITSLVQDWEQALASDGYNLVKGKKAESARTLTSALSMTLSALEEAMPQALRQNQTGKLFVQSDGSGLTGQWESAPDTYDLKGLVASRLGLAGNVSGNVEVLPGAAPQKQPDELLVDIVTAALASGKNVLPGFLATDAQPGKSATLVWQAPQI